MSVNTGSLKVNTSQSLRRGETDDVRSYYSDVSALDKGGVGRGVDEEIRFQRQDTDGGPITWTASHQVW